MKRWIYRGCTLLAALAVTLPAWAACPDYLQREMRLLRSEQNRDLCQSYGGQALLIVNTASQCGFTPQFTGLEALYQEYRDRGLRVLGFPSDDFRQEHDDEAQTAQVCYANYGVTFDMFAPIAVRGRDADPLFRALAEQSTTPKWNFYKYVVDRQGKVVASFSSRVKPEDEKLRAAIEQALAE